MKKVLALVLSLVMLFSLCATAFAGFHTQAEIEAMGNYYNGTYYTDNEVANDAISREVAEDSYVLFKNNGVLPIAKSGKIALFGNGATGTIKGGSGSGIVNQRERDWIDTAFRDAGYEITTPQAYFDRVGRGNVATGFSGDREAVDVALTDAWLEEAMAADTAIYVLARTAGEGADRQLTSGNGAWELKAAERSNIEKIAANFENVIVVLNTYVTDITWTEEIDNIDAVLHIGYGGQKTGITTLRTLNGTVTPSGKANATWAWELEDFLSSEAGFSWMDGNTTMEVYNDGIYVGYRYFDTFGKYDEVAYPFGFGLSYTDFDIDVVDVAIDEEEVEVTVDVTNVGAEYSGKEVIQVYFSAPDGELEKPYQELAAFGKTDLLAPGQKQTLTISFDTADMSSYSEARAAYILEAGEYFIRVGNSSRNTVVAAAATLEETVVTEQLVNQFALEPNNPLDEVSKKGVDPITYDGEDAEKAAALADATVLDVDVLKSLTVDNSDYLKELDKETAYTYLFAEDYENYVPRENITINTKQVAGILANRPNQGGEDANAALPLDASGRYVKIQMSNPATQYGFSFYELFIYSGEENVARYKAVEASSEGDYDNPPYLSVNGVDGSLDTRWGSNYNAGDRTNSWFIVDLGQVYDLDGISMVWEGAYARNIDIQVSDDGVNYTSVKSAAIPGTGMTVKSSSSGVRGYQSTTYNEEKVLVDALPDGYTKDTVKLTDVLSGEITLEQFVASLSVAEMARLANAEGQGGSTVAYIYDDDGNILSYTQGMRSNMARSTHRYYASRHIPALAFTDGPAGLRCDKEGSNPMICPQIKNPGDQGGTHFYTLDGGINAVREGTAGAEKVSMYPTAFPGTTNIAATWNPEMMYKMGYGVGVEMREYNVNAWLAPGINIVRNPMCGRNFEYYSEDPVLSGIGAAYTTFGVQSSNGVGVCLKHFWGNNQENNRNAENNIISERAAREIYLEGYKIVIELAQPMYIMTSYNENNGWPSADSYDACTNLARGEWGFKGAIMTDWNGGQSSPHVSMHAGNDFICPGKNTNQITNYLGITAPTFRADGRIQSAGSFVAAEGGAYEYIAPVANYEALHADVLAAIEAGQAKFCHTAEADFVTWYGDHSNRIVLGDLQKSAMNILNMMLYTQDLEILCNDLGIEYPEQYHNFSKAYDAPLFFGWTNVEKSDVVNVGLVADTVVADCADGEALVDIIYTGDADLSTVRFYIDSALPIADIYSDYDIEYNPAEGYVVIWGVDGIDDVVATIVYDISANPWLANGEYPIALEVVDATDFDEFDVDVKGIPGAVIIDNTYAAGDANLDGIVSNADVINIARYLVNLVEFNAEQFAAADV
ncbi:MAG: hypothetical protein E7456_05810, partial [Ruminococcaceae bacterium]|nr:hypothetical protein [Oscillospiraceae bacterium]